MNCKILKDTKSRALMYVSNANEEALFEIYIKKTGQLYLKGQRSICPDTRFQAMARNIVSIYVKQQRG